MRSLILSILFAISPLITVSACAKQERVKEHRLVLYYRPTCPYCIPVKALIDKFNLPVTTKDISDRANRRELLERGGKIQVPCLLIDGKPMYEGRDIFNWLKQAFARKLLE